MGAIPFRRNRVSRRFMMMPLVDVIFLLLTFFMLSSQISPYGILPVGAVAQGGGSAAPAPASATERLLVTVLPGGVLVNGRRLSLDAFAAQAAALRSASGGSAVVAPRRTATVQDVVFVLEHLRAAQFAKVAIRTWQNPS